MREPNVSKNPSHGSYGRVAKLGALWSVLRHGGHELISIPASMVMARLLDPYDFGVAAAAAFFVQFGTRLLNFGFNAAIVRIKVLRREHEASVFAVNLGIGAAAYVVLFLSAPSIGRFFNSPEAGAVIPWAALVFLISPWGSVPSALLQRTMQFRSATIAVWADNALGAITALVLAFRGFGFWSIVFGALVGEAVRVTAQLVLTRWRPSVNFSRGSMHELLGFGLGVHARRMLEYATWNLDNLVVARVLGLTALGYYDKAFTTMNRLVIRLTLGEAPFRIFAIIHEDGERFRRAYSRLILSVTLLGYPVLAGCIVTAHSLIVLLYGERWVPAVLPFQLLCLGGMCKLLNGYASQANEASGHLWPQVLRQAIGTIMVVVGAALGSVLGGVNGAAAGVLVAMLLLTVLMQGLVRHATGLSWQAMLAPQIPALTGTALLVLTLVGTAAGVTSMWPEVASWQLLMIQGFVGALSYSGFVIFSPFVAVRALVRETAHDLLPPALVRVFNQRLGLQWLQ
jgi:O-antigen/teichoic acid export membrane protein